MCHTIHILQHMDRADFLNFIRYTDPYELSDIELESTVVELCVLRGVARNESYVNSKPRLITQHRTGTVIGCSDEDTEEEIPVPMDLFHVLLSILQ